MMTKGEPFQGRDKGVERKQVEREFTEERNKFKSILKAIENAVTIRDLDYNLTYHNHVVTNVFGNSLGKKCYRVFHGLDTICSGCPVKLAYRDGKSHTSIRKVVLPSGETTFWENTANPVRDSDGNITSCVEINTNITEHKRAEETLRESEEKYRTLFEESRDAVYVSTREGNLLDVNQFMMELFGYTREEVIGLDVRELYVHHDDRNWFQKEIEQKGFVRDYEVKLRKKDGTEMDCLITATVRQANGGTILGYQGIIRDITERKRAAGEIRRVQERFSGIYNSSKDAIGYATLEGALLDVNDAFCQLTGYTREKLLAGKTYQEITPEEYHEYEAQRIKSILRTGKPEEYEKEYIRKDGSRVPILLTTFLIRGDDGEPIGLAAIIKDVTERRWAEEREKELQQELYLSSRLASIGELAAGVAHEINNPLTGIIGFSQRLLRKSTDETVKRDLERIHNEALRAAMVVQNLLTFARRHEPKKEYSDVNDILQKALELRAYELRTSNIEAVTDTAPSLPQIMADFHQIQEVFLNIILNAEQAMTEANCGGKLSIKTWKTKGYIRVSFTDNGPGIPAEQLDKVFDPFFTTRGERGGTGLGLSVCHGIMAEHGGRIYARSKPGEGTTFFIELPLTTEKTEENTVIV